MLPKVYFQLGDLGWDMWCASYHLSDSLFRKRLLKRYPSLSKFRKSKMLKEKLKIFYLNEYRKNINQICKTIIKFQKTWDKVNDRFMKNLSLVLETRVDRQWITGFISVHPIGPRDWEDWRFGLPYFYSDNAKVFVTAHEIIHMFYFKKLIEEFPKKDTKQFNSRGREWKLSEVLANVILNDPRISKALGIKTEPVKSYVCNDGITSEFNELYKKHLKKKTSFVTFYKKARKLADRLL